MTIRTILRTFFESLNPSVYRGLTQRSLYSVISYLVVISFIYVCVMGLINLPNYIDTYKSIDTGDIENLSVSLNIQTKEPITISRNPSIIIDTSENRSYDGEDLLITKDTLYRKWFFTKRSKEIEDVDLLKDRDNFRRNTLLLSLVLIPSVLVLALIFIILKYTLISIIFSGVGLIVIKAVKHRTGFFEIFKTAVYSLTIYFIVNLISVFFKLPFLGLIFYTVLFILSLLLIEEETFEFRPARRR